jgi:hypothetical protein
VLFCCGHVDRNWKLSGTVFLVETGPGRMQVWEGGVQSTLGLSRGVIRSRFIYPRRWALNVCTSRGSNVNRGLVLTKWENNEKLTLGIGQPGVKPRG